jgi:hypothetical protein
MTINHAEFGFVPREPLPAGCLLPVAGVVQRAMGYPGKQATVNRQPPTMAS